MAVLSLKEISTVLKGDTVNGRPNVEFVDFHFDSRLIDQDNTLFFALKSEKADGHAYIPQIQGKPGIGAVINRDFPVEGLKMPLVRVDDTLTAAQQLASYVRNRYRSIKYIGITGSAGKTTTKEFLYQLLSHKYRSFRSPANWNNWLGMPFSILQLFDTKDMAIFELAMSSPGIGEIDLLARILRPDVAVVLNAYPTHLEFLKTVENVALGKSEILNYLESDDVAFINGDLDYLVAPCRLKKGRKIFFGKGENNDIILRQAVREGQGTRIYIDFHGLKSEFRANLVNRLHIENLFAAIVVAQHLGMKHIEIQAAMAGIQPLAGRGQIRRLGDLTIIDETYNANPEAMKKTLTWVDQEYRQNKIAVLGDMLELGEGGAAFHEQVGKHFAGLAYSLLLTVGKRAEIIAGAARENGFPASSTRSFADARSAGVYLKTAVSSGSVVLLKGSRGIHLEEVLKELTDDQA